MSADSYVDQVRRRLTDMPFLLRRRVVGDLAAQVAELRETGADPAQALGTPAEYAERLRSELADVPEPERARWSVLGVPVDLRGPIDARVRSRVWDPANPRIVVPRLFGAGWTINLGALAVRLHLIRPDDVDEDTLARIPAAAMAAAQATPLVIAGTAAAALAARWRSLPEQVPVSWGAGGHPTRWGGRGQLVLMAAIGVAPAAWAQLPAPGRGDRLLRSSVATSQAVLAGATLAATLRGVRRGARPGGPAEAGGRSGLLIPAALPVGVAAGLAVIVLPVRAGLRAAWRAAQEGAR